MNISLDEHPYFEKWIDPESGAISYLLKERVAPIQQSFYFTNPSVSPDEKWLWFYAAFPPSPHKFLACINLDPAHPQKFLFLQASFSSASPMVAPEGNAVYFCMGASVWKMDLSGVAKIICTLDEDYINKRELRRLATHLTMSSDGKYFLLDGEIGNHWFVGLGEIATGKVTILKEFIHHHNHAQFSPHRADIFLIAQDWFFDRITGRRYAYDHRIWLMDTQNQIFENLDPDIYCRHQGGDSHEWWSKDGLIGYVNYAKGAYEINIDTRIRTHVWKTPLCHAQCSADRQFWCADQSPYQWQETRCQVRFFDRQREKELPIISNNPLPPYPRNAYHIDPHPQFSPLDTWVVHTTTVKGQVDIALSPTQALKELISSKSSI